MNQRKCTALTAAGNKCGSIARTGSDFCYRHDPERKTTLGRPPRPKSMTVERDITKIESLHDLITEAGLLYNDLLHDRIVHRQAIAAAKILQQMAYSFDLIHKHDKDKGTGNIASIEGLQTKIREIYGLSAIKEEEDGTRNN